MFRHPVGIGQNSNHESIIQGTLPGYIHQTGSVCLRQLGEAGIKMNNTSVQI